MFKFIFELLVFYLLYKLIFEFIIPIYNASKQMSKKMGEFQQQMNQENKTAKTSPKDIETTPKANVSDDDYIDYEEIK
jgi:hypothetical protein